MNAKLSKLAITSLAAGILGFVMIPLTRNLITYITIPPLLGAISLILGFTALKKIKSSKDSLKGNRLAIAGIILGAVIYLLIVLGVLFALSFRTHYQPFHVPATSMEPTIKKDEKIMVDRKAYANSLPQRGDIIVHKAEVKGKKQLFLKRIVGFPNEQLEIRDGNVYINNKLASGLPKEVYYYNGGDFGKKGQIVKIPNDCYYMLGDNSLNSLDSRYTGSVNKKDIYGKVILNYTGKYPPDQEMFGLLRSFFKNKE